MKFKTAKLTNKDSKSSAKIQRKSGVVITYDNPQPWLVKVKNLTKKYGDNVVLENVNLTVNRQERVAIVGANGTGKTTISEIIGLIKSKTSGDIEYNFKKKINPKKNIGFQFQDSIYPDGVKTSALIQFYKELYRDELVQENFTKLSSLFRIEEFHNKVVRSLSGGQKQRLNLFLSIFHHPELLILDELSTGLDIETRFEIIEYINEIIEKENLSLLLVSHNQDEINLLCNRLIIIEDKNIKYDYSKETLPEKYENFGDFINKYFLDRKQQNRENFEKQIGGR